MAAVPSPAHRAALSAIKRFDGNVAVVVTALELLKHLAHNRTRAAVRAFSSSPLVFLLIEPWRVTALSSAITVQELTAPGTSAHKVGLDMIEAFPTNDEVIVNTLGMLAHFAKVGTCRKERRRGHFTCRWLARSFTRRSNFCPLVRSLPLTAPSLSSLPPSFPRARPSSDIQTLTTRSWGRLPLMRASTPWPPSSSSKLASTSWA